MSVDPPSEYDPDTEVTFVSKSERKREMAALQKLGETLLELPAGQFSQVPVSDPLRAAVELAKTLKQREARRRQLQYIGKLMRAEDHQKIAATLAGFEDTNRLFRQHFQRLENIREALVGPGDAAFEQLVDTHHELDRQHLRQLIRQARKEAEQEKPPAASRKLFKYLRTTLLPD